MNTPSNMTRAIKLATVDLCGEIEYSSDNGAVFKFYRREDAMTFASMCSYEHLFEKDARLSDKTVFVFRK